MAPKGHEENATDHSAAKSRVWSIYSVSCYSGNAGNTVLRMFIQVNTTDLLTSALSCKFYLHLLKCSKPQSRE